MSATALCTPGAAEGTTSMCLTEPSRTQSLRVRFWRVEVVEPATPSHQPSPKLLMEACRAGESTIGAVWTLAADTNFPRMQSAVSIAGSKADLGGGTKARSMVCSFWIMKRNDSNEMLTVGIHSGLCGTNWPIGAMVVENRRRCV